MTPSLVIDGIGSISFNSFFLLQFFYSEQLHRMECLSQEPVLFEDVLCQMHDMIQPAKEGCFTLADLRRHKQLAGTLFNMLFNLHKFIAFETRDPFLARQVSITNHQLPFVLRVWAEPPQTNCGMAQLAVLRYNHVAWHRVYADYKSCYVSSM